MPHPRPLPTEPAAGPWLGTLLRQRVRAWAARPSRAAPYGLLVLLGLLLWGRLLLQEPPRVATAAPEATATVHDVTRQN